jgi:hypothetical protein
MVLILIFLIYSLFHLHFVGLCTFDGNDRQSMGAVLQPVNHISPSGVHNFLLIDWQIHSRHLQDQPSLHHTR